MRPPLALLSARELARRCGCADALRRRLLRSTLQPRSSRSRSSTGSRRRRSATRGSRAGSCVCLRCQRVAPLSAGADLVARPRPLLRRQPPEPFNELSPSHVLITASFGAILSRSALALFPDHQKLNVHPSLLPRYRGASPIQYALLNQDATTGVTVQELSDRGADTGAIFAQEEFVSPCGLRSGVLLPGV